MRLLGESPATAEQLLPSEIREWIARWRAQGLTLAQAKTQATLLHAEIGRKRGKLAADAWWKQLIKEEPRLQ